MINVRRYAAIIAVPMNVIVATKLAGDPIAVPHTP
jgi:hypothetical protein